MPAGTVTCTCCPSGVLVWIIWPGETSTTLQTSQTRSLRATFWLASCNEVSLDFRPPYLCHGAYMSTWCNTSKYKSFLLTYVSIIFHILSAAVFYLQIFYPNKNKVLIAQFMPKKHCEENVDFCQRKPSRKTSFRNRFHRWKWKRSKVVVLQMAKNNRLLLGKNGDHVSFLFSRIIYNIKQCITWSCKYYICSLCVLQISMSASVHK